MLKQLMHICYEDKVDLYIDDIKTFNNLRHRVAAKNPLKNDLDREVVQENHTAELKSKARKFYNRRSRHKNKAKYNKFKG